MGPPTSKVTYISRCVGGDNKGSFTSWTMTLSHVRWPFAKVPLPWLNFLKKPYGSVITTKVIHQSTKVIQRYTHQTTAEMLQIQCESLIKELCKFHARVDNEIYINHGTTNIKSYLNINVC